MQLSTILLLNVFFYYYNFNYIINNFIFFICSIYIYIYSEGTPSMTFMYSSIYIIDNEFYQM